MTLILTWIDPEVTVHVADRRISLAHANGRIVPRDDLWVKTVLVGGSLLCSCSGVAEPAGSCGKSGAAACDAASQAYAG